MFADAWPFEGIELVILNPNVSTTIPASSLANLTDDLYFRLIPVKSTITSAEIQARALANEEIVLQPKAAISRWSAVQ